MEQTEEQHSPPGIRLKAEKVFEAVYVIKCLVYDGQADNRVNDVGVRMHAAEHTDKKSQAVADREQTDVLNNIFQPVKEEDDSNQKQQMVVASNHVFRSQIHERSDRAPLISLNELCVILRNVMRGGGNGYEQTRNEHDGGD